MTKRNLSVQRARALGITYYNLTKTVIEKHPREGEMAIRQGLRAYGKFRGELLRKWHEELGFPINVYSLINWWDHDVHAEGYDFGPEAEKAFQPQCNTPYRVVHPAIACDLYEVQKENNWEHYGLIYCDEIHQGVAKAYHPDSIVEIHENLMKNDPYCHFTWIMPPEISEDEIDSSGYERMKKWVEEKPEEKHLYYTKRNAMRIGILYFFLAEAIIDRFGSKGKKMVESSLKEMGKMRGKDLKWKLAKEKIKLTVKNVFENYDMPYKEVWDINVKDSKDKFLVECTFCPLAEGWHEAEGWHDTKDTGIGSMYCRTQYEAIFKELSSEAEINITQSIAEGASKCILAVKL